MLRHPTPHVSPACCLLPPRGVTRVGSQSALGGVSLQGSTAGHRGRAPPEASSVMSQFCSERHVQRSGDLAGFHHTTTGRSHDGVRFPPHVPVFLQQAWIPYAVITVTLDKHSKRANTPQAVGKHAAVSSSFGILKTVLLGGTRVAQGRPGLEAASPRARDAGLPAGSGVSLTCVAPRGSSHTGPGGWSPALALAHPCPRHLTLEPFTAGGLSCASSSHDSKNGGSWSPQHKWPLASAEF